MPTEKQKYTTYCNIPNAEGQPCGAAIVVTGGIIEPQVGGSTDEKTKQYVQAIVAHLQKKHPGHAMHALTTWEQFLGFLAVGFTRTDDPGAPRFMASFGDYLCKISTLPVTDDMIVQIVAAMGLTMDDPQRQRIIDAITYVRNFQLRKITPQMPATIPGPSPVTP